MSLIRSNSTFDRIFDVYNQLIILLYRYVAWMCQSITSTMSVSNSTVQWEPSLYLAIIIMLLRKRGCSDCVRVASVHATSAALYLLYSFCARVRPTRDQSEHCQCHRTASSHVTYSGTRLNDINLYH